jgi:hypothetical protein
MAFAKAGDAKSKCVLPNALPVICNAKITATCLDISLPRENYPEAVISEVYG